MEYLGPGNEGVSPQAAAGILTERLKNAGDLGDRRDALDALLKLSQEHPTEVGHAGMPIFTDILQAGIADRSMTQTIMGIMLNLVKEQDDNVSYFLKDVQNVQNLLDLLENADALTALSAVQVLQALQRSSADSLESCILECPAGLQALVEVLRDPREEVRNEVILFLGQLTSRNLEVKKFVAFQEGFERLFDIMSREGMLEGGSVIVKDCLHVCLNLLTDSSMTKALFCQSGCLNRLHDLIDVRTAEGREIATTNAGAVPETESVEKGREEAPPTPGMTEVQVEIACKTLDLLAVLLARQDSGGEEKEEGVDDGKRSERQTLVADVGQGVLSEMLAHVAFSKADAFSHSPIACRERAMKVTGALVDGHPTNQYNLGESLNAARRAGCLGFEVSTVPLLLCSPIQLLIQDVGLDSVALATLVMEGALGKAGADPSITEAFDWVLACLFRGNELVCTQVMSHVIAPPPPPLELEDMESWVPPTPPGKVLLDSLASSSKILFEGGDNGEGGGIAAARAAGTLSRGCMIVSMLFTHGGALAKEVYLRVPLAPAPHAHPTTLVHVLLRWLELATSHPGTTAPGLDTASTVNSSSSGDSGSPAHDVLEVGRAAASAGIALMQLLCRWMHGCQAAAREVLENPANLFIVDVAAGRSSLLHLEDKGGASAAQRVALRGLACLMLGLLLEYVEGVAAPKSGSGSGGEWTRALVMKMINNRVGMTPFMASIEAAKRAFSEAEKVQRRRHRAERDWRGSPSNSDGQEDATDGELRLDAGFGALLVQASEEVRRRVISILTLGESSSGGSVTASELNSHGKASTPGASPAGEEGGAGSSSAAVVSRGDAGLASMVELQEKEIASLRYELSEALSRVPRGVGEGGGASALEEALRNQVGQLEEASVEKSKEYDSLRRELSDALAELEEGKESRQLLTSELEGLTVSVSSLERQLLDRDAICEGLRRQLEAGESSSARETELARQLEEAHARTLKAEEALELSQRQSMADASADEAAQKASLEAAAQREAQIQQLQMALDEARENAAAAAAKAIADSDSSAEKAAASAELTTTKKELEGARESLLEWKTMAERMEQVLEDKTEKEEASQREVVLLRKAVDEAESCAEQKQQAMVAMEARFAEEAKTAAAEAEILRHQLENTVRNLAEASSGGSQQVKALQKELSAVQEREEREVSEWRRRFEQSKHQAREDAERSKAILGQTEKRLNDEWSIQLQEKNAAIVQLKAETAASTEAHEVATSRLNLQLQQLREQNEGLGAQGKQVDVLMARCARLEEAVVSTRAETEERLRGEMERERGLTRGAEESVSALSKRLEDALKEVSEKEASAADLRDRLDEVQAFLSQSEDERQAAEAREAAALSEAKGTEQSLRAAEDRLLNANAELEDRDAVIAVVEDARAAQEREAERLRDKLNGLGKSLTPLTAESNGFSFGTEDSGNGNRKNGVTRGMSHGDQGDKDDMVDSAEYLELLSEHEDLLQLLAQQDVVRKKLSDSLRDNAGHAAVRAAMKDAEAVVTATYGMFVHTDGHDEGSVDDNQFENEVTAPGPDTDAGDSDQRRRTVAV